MPAGIRASGPPAQSDALSGQRQSVRIEIHRVQLFGDGHPDVVHPLDRCQAGEVLSFRRAVLAFHLDRIETGHSPF